MEIDCEALIDRYLLIKNPVYTFSFPISVLVAIVVFGFIKAYKYSNNSYINQILIPLSALLVTMVFIDLVSRSLISKEEKERLKKLCSSYMNDPNKLKLIKHQKAINMADVEKYDGNVDGFENTDNEQNVDEPSMDLLENKSNLSNVHIFDNITTKFVKIPKSNGNDNELVGDFPKDKIKCVGDTKTFNGNLCSGANDKPNGLVASVPGPLWLPQNASTVQKRLKTNNYTKNRCLGEPELYAN